MDGDKPVSKRVTTSMSEKYFSGVLVSMIVFCFCFEPRKALVTVHNEVLLRSVPKD